MEKPILEFLGSDSGFGLKNNSAYIENGNKITIIDCGFTVFQELQKKFNFNKYKEINIIITHLHNDHAGTLSQFVLYLYFIYNKKVKIISKCKKIQEYLEITGTPKDAYTLINDDESIEFIKTEHVKHLDAYGFKLIVEEKKIVYTGDTNTLEPFREYLENVQEFYVDVSKFGGAHLKIDDVIEELREIKNKGIDVYLMHIDDRNYIESITNNEFYYA